MVLGALVGELLLAPYSDLHAHFSAFAGLTVFLLMLSFLRHTAPPLVVRWLFLPLASVWLTARILEGFNVAPLRCAQLASSTGLLVSVCLMLLMFNRFASIDKSTAGVLSEAITTYLLIAISFSQLYEVIDGLMGHAFNRTIASPRGSTLLYFSMVTLSSIGYDDLFPLSPYVRLIAALESMVGIFYVAIVVARLVSTGVQNATNKSD